MKKLSLCLALFVLCLSGSAAAPSAQAATTVLEGTGWVLSSLNGQLPLPGDPITLQFAADVASGSDGCNQYTIPYTTKNATISFGAANAATTMMACPEAVMNQATAYMQALADADKYEVRGTHLTLLSGRKVVASFVAGLQDLAGTTWQVTGYNNGREAVVGVLVGADITAAFDQNGEVTGNAGCNEYFGPYLTAGGSIMIGNIGATRKFCSTPAGVMEQETAYLAALQTAATYTIDGNQLTLRDRADAIAVTMQRTLNVAIPTPVPGVPTGRVIAPSGVNVRSGPGTNFPVIGFAPFGTEGEIVGRNANSTWWAASAPAVPGGVGWVSADFVAVTNAADVPVMAAPPVYVPPAPPTAVATPSPVPTPLPQPTATPAPQISFSGSPTTINQGQCATLTWSVENVQAVWVYPQGQPYQQYPRTGQGSEQVCPPQTTTYEIRVLLRDGSVVTRTVTINVVPAAPQNPLNGTAWQVTGYYIGGAVASPIVGTTITARFDAEQVTGNAGCNEYFGSYFVSGSNISIGSLSTGMMACAEPGVMQQESDYLAALQSSATFRFDGNRLELRRADGTLTVSLTRLQ